MKKTAREIAEDVMTRLGPEREEDMKLLSYLPRKFDYTGPAFHTIDDDAKLREAIRNWKHSFVRRGVGVTAGLGGILGTVGAIGGAMTADKHPVLGGVAGGLLGTASGSIPMALLTQSYKKERDRADKLSPEELNSIRRLSLYGGGFE